MKIIAILLLIGQILMAAKIDTIEVHGVKIPFIYEEDTRLPLMTTQLVFTNSGSVKNTKIAGLASLSAKILNEGTKTLGSNAFAEALEAKAISLSASTGTETFVIEMSSLKEEYAEGMGYFEDLLKDPNYTEEALSKVKTMRLGSLSNKENDFDYIASNELKALLFQGTVLAQPSAGTVESISGIELSDVEFFLKENLVLSKAIVVVGGDIDLKEVKERMSKLLALLPKGEKESAIHCDVVKKPQSNTLLKETQQAYIYFGAPYNMKVDSEDYYKARVATYILGTGGFGSRLMEEIRVKRGLAYSAYAKVNVSHSSSYFDGYLQTKLESMNEAQKTVKDVITKFVKKGVTQEELDQTKQFLLGSEPLRVETMSQRLNRTFMDYYRGFEIGHSERELEKISSLKLKELNAFIKSHSEIEELTFAIVTK